jgi:hypothetical protein
MVLVLFLWSLNGVGAQFPTHQVVTEQEKIQYLLATIAQSRNCVFIRNGKSYSPKEAANHMEMKWKKHQDKITSAMDFIDIVATKSNLTQQPYLIQHDTGRVEELGTYLKKVLNDKYG